MMMKMLRFRKRVSLCSKLFENQLLERDDVLRKAANALGQLERGARVLAHLPIELLLVHRHFVNRGVFARRRLGEDGAHFDVGL